MADPRSTPGDPPAGHDDTAHDDAAHDDTAERPVDVGFTHVAIPASDMDASIAFYREFAGMEVVHERGEPGHRVAWITDHTRPFVVVLMERSVDHRLGGWSHLGIGLESREEVDRILRRAADAGLDVQGAFDDGQPVGYWGIIADPDGHQLEVAFGQEVAFTVENAR